MKNLFLILLLILPFKGFCEVFPIQIIKGLIVSDALIDGQSVLVILDTGAPGLVLNQKYYNGDKQPGIPCNGINGSFECKTHLVNEWNWLGTTHKKTKALVSNLTFLEQALNREVHAIIGLSVLEDFYLSVDFDHKTITLSKEFADDKQGSFFRFDYANHLPIITCKINGVKKTLGLDTGSECNYLFNFDDNDDAELLASASPVLIIGTENKGDIKHRLLMGIELNNNPVTILSSFIVDLEDDGYMKHTSFDGILGQSFLSNFNITIHPGKQKIMLTPRIENSPLASVLMP